MVLFVVELEAVLEHLRVDLEDALLRRVVLEALLEYLWGRRKEVSNLELLGCRRNRD